MQDRRLKKKSQIFWLHHIHDRLSSLSTYPSAISPRSRILHPDLNLPKARQTACDAIIRLTPSKFPANKSRWISPHFYISSSSSRSTLTGLRQTSCSHTLKRWKTPCRISSPLKRTSAGWSTTGAFFLFVCFFFWGGGSFFFSFNPLFQRPHVQPITRIVSWLVSLVFITFHKAPASLVGIYTKTNLHYFKYPTHNFPLSAVFPLIHAWLIWLQGQ